MNNLNSRRRFLFSAIAAGAIGHAASASPINVAAQREREFQLEGWPATEFNVSLQQLGALDAACGMAVKLYDPVTRESLLVPLFDLSLLTEAKFEEGLKASARSHGTWHKEQGQAPPPPVHFHLIRVVERPNLRALLVHCRKCVLVTDRAAILTTS